MSDIHWPPELAMPQSSIRLNPSGQTFCHYCGQGFKRDEHLERHILTHTNLRPFQCRECKLTFKRKDLLRRHYRRIHSASSNQNVSQDNKNEAPSCLNMGRIPIACINCAQTKTRCDDRTPCTRCSKKGISCERRKLRRSSFKDAQTQKKYDEVRGYGQIQLVQQGEGLVAERDTDEFEESGQSSGLSGETTATGERPRSGSISCTDPKSLRITSDATNIMANVADLSSGLDPRCTDYIFPFDASTEQILNSDLDLNFFANEGVLHDTLDGNSILIPGSDTAYSDPDWRLFHKERPVLPDTVPEQMPTPKLINDTCNQWSLYRCNPTTSGRGQSGLSQPLANIRVLESPEIWSLCASQSNTQLKTISLGDPTTFKPCDASTRDCLLSVTQQIWRIARQETACSWPMESNGETDAWMDRIILLPPTEVMHSFLERYMDQENRQFHLFPAQDVTTSASLLNTDNQLLSGLMVLVIIAQVTRNSAEAEARALSNGLIALCRIVVQDTEWAFNLEQLEISLSLVQLLQWSGEACHMSGVLEMWEQHAKDIQRFYLQKSVPHGTAIERIRTPRVGAEPMGNAASSRLLYSWMAVDLELSLFQDLTPKLSIQDFSSAKLFPLPSERLFSQTSLAALFEAFMDGHLSGNACITVSSLHLLLHPLQCVSAHLHQCLATFDSVQDSGKELNSTFGLASRAFIDELGTLLKRWHDLYLCVTNESGRCATARGSLALYHIMKLNNLASFPDVERLIRENTTGRCTGNSPPRSWMRIGAANTKAVLLFHCGQCLYQLRALPSTARPLWWAAALYRVTLFLSLAIISNATYPGSGFKSGSSFESFPSTHSSLIVLDREYNVGEADEDMSLQRFLARLQGTPVLTRPDGSTLFLATAIDVLDYCIDMLDQHLLFDSTAFASGIHVKLNALRSRWREGAHIA